jgi:hypothetical protein
VPSAVKLAVYRDVDVIKRFYEQAKTLFEKHRDLYIKEYLGQPTERLSVRAGVCFKIISYTNKRFWQAFFDGVEKLMASGVASTEVGFQIAFSKGELKAAIALYPVSAVRVLFCWQTRRFAPADPPSHVQVKKGLEAAYRRIERQLCSEEAMLEPVWDLYQTMYLKQTKRYADLIAQCFPNSQLRLEFDTADVAPLFEVIGKSS